MIMTASKPQNYIFGYGSLIDDESRERTTAAARYAFPVVVKDIARGWWARGAPSGLTTTFLGAIDRKGASCNGVIYPVTPEEIDETDHRETAGYKRVKVEPEDITMLDGRKAPPDGDVWVYLNQIPPEKLADNLPSPSFPMVQSYVDICVAGCIEVEHRYPTAAGFTEQFLAATRDWSRFWVNDRSQPRRAFAAQPAAGDIDTALLSCSATAELFYEVELEPASWEDRKPVKPPQIGARPVKPSLVVAAPRRHRLVRPGWVRGG